MFLRFRVGADFQVLNITIVLVLTHFDLRHPIFTLTFEKPEDVLILSEELTNLN